MTAMTVPTQPALKRTPLYDLHVAMGARMAPFAGYEMPIQYPAGVMKEHLHTRAAASLFDVSHMGQIALRPSGGTPADIALALERLVPADVLGLAPGRQRYAYFTNAHGGIIDDLMITACGDHVALVVNASRKEVDEAHLRAAMSPVCTMGCLMIAPCWPCKGRKPRKRSPASRRRSRPCASWTRACSRSAAAPAS